MNCDSISSYDVGIAGLHRIFPVLKQFVEAEVDVIVVVAGMEGALASIVSSIADVPVIGVPTSIGYGYGEKGVAALASMLQSCSLGLTVVNIDNGVGAGAAAANIASRIKSILDINYSQTCKFIANTKPINATPVPSPAISKPPFTIPVCAILDFTAPTMNEAVTLIPTAIASAL